ncbi:protein gvpG [Haloferax mediterranei ATCC 33500]|uniref:Gas vesicle protein G n=2 Tax=Haloferax mediterranei (strain ATCC 33500 / DSM 1411 / JCM 8866 / NBRC 14739 / NCIMB 2177 / R-4) TaxID=523841 RepID=GVPG_HALMT|nr:protein gvpG [Haloferax mediterranei]Q02232.1 RecName: Full=Gas vesicle protein G; Short=GvpG [Haloferax mediterranei ATCC 33500]AFK19406.1 gas-vesicle operon protein gvpG [Haloferax mediterranei ATCC 33500]AHZ21244.1 protein gvpG [Haloferax mediterranei ATCC 33500]EMA04405.1 gas-vesicle operon protein gvpG [Haloferax mediterranei ATCC 33500]MDX5989509.1 protein gvpG [Haloferax mediterranei ATCC 33500]QCQ75868.1 protein gvpG [Haloferax mediterranei ATCC 33500]
MFLVDDLLVNPFLSLLDILHTMALDEMNDMEEIRDEIKENQLLYEIGERSETDYQQRKQQLEARLETAERIQAQMQGRIEVKR